MESILISFISLALIIISTVTMTMSTLNSATKLSESWKAIQDKTINIQKTTIVSIPPESYAGGNIEIVVVNQGQVSISDFTHWDAIVEDQAGNSRYLIYSNGTLPASNQWVIEAIMISEDQDEVFDIGILNPGERMIMGLNPDPPLLPGEPIKVTIATADGVTTQCFIASS